jgi:hypothetical protein
VNPLIRPAREVAESARIPPCVLGEGWPAASRAARAV